MLQDFIEDHREELIARARTKVAERRSPHPTDVELSHGVPLFLKQLAAILREHGTAASQGREIASAATLHGAELLRMGLTVAQVVHAYGDVCQAVTELAVETQAPVGTEDFRTLNRCLDDAIASAVTEYMRQHDVERVQAQSAKETERLGVFAHELRNHVNAGLLALEALKSGRVGIAGSTGRILQRSLNGLRELVDRSLTEVRLSSAASRWTVFRAAELMEEVEIAAALEARQRQNELVVDRVNFDWFIKGDRQLLASALANLLQNAIKFNKPGGRVSVRTRGEGGRILFEIEDECGGLPQEKIDQLFQPFSQASSNRSGLGLGLTISRRAVEANEGRLTARDLPGKGCVFVVDLPLGSSRDGVEGG